MTWNLFPRKTPGTVLMHVLWILFANWDLKSVLLLLLFHVWECMCVYMCSCVGARSWQLGSSSITLYLIFVTVSYWIWSCQLGWVSWSVSSRDLPTSALGIQCVPLAQCFVHGFRSEPRSFMTYPCSSFLKAHDSDVNDVQKVVQMPYNWILCKIMGLNYSDPSRTLPRQCGHNIYLMVCLLPSSIKLELNKQMRFKVPRVFYSSHSIPNHIQEARIVADISFLLLFWE